MRIILPFLSLVLLLASCSSRSEQAALYNDRIIDRQIDIVLALNELDSTLNDLETDKIDDAYHILRGKIKEGIRTLDSIGDFKGDAVLLQASKTLFTGYDELAAGPYHELITLLQLPDSAYGADQQMQSFELEDQIGKGIESLHMAFEKQQRSFGERYNVVFE